MNYLYTIGQRIRDVLSGRTSMQMTDASLIEAVNLAYHEEEASLYDGRHPEIFQEETERWSRICKEVENHKNSLGRSLVLLDVGSGTGFVPQELAPVLSSEDEVILLDPSPAMLEKAEQRLRTVVFPAKSVMKVGTLASVGLADATLDVATINSVAHHLPKPDESFAIIDRLLSPGGLLVVAHEPNIRHFQHLVIGNLDRLFRIVRRLRSTGGGSDGSFIDGVNSRLIQQGVITSPMSIETVESLVDIQSPTAGREVRSARGFNPMRLAPALVGYRIVSIETYCHFGKTNPAKIRLLRPIVSWIERVWPNEGALFTVILEKPL